MSHRVIADLEARSALQVFQVQRAQPAVAAWLHRLLTPVVAACRLQGSYPLELRPMGPWAGFTLGSTFVPDGRVAVSSQLILWSHRSIVATIKDYHAFCAAERKKEEAAELEALAQERWGHDDAALKFECDLVSELGTARGQLAFANWCHAAGKHLDCKVEEISCNVQGLLSGSTDRIRAALTVKQGMDRSRANKWVGWRGQTTVICGWPDYQAYLAYRREVASTSARIVQMAAGVN